MTAAGSGGVTLMTSAPNEIGGRPWLQEMANPHKSTQILRNRALFNPVIKVLMAHELAAGDVHGATPSGVRQGN